MMLWLLDLREDDVPVGDWPNPFYLLTIFGQKVEREGRSPHRLNYTICVKELHVHVAEWIDDETRQARIVGTEPCETDHLEDVSRVAVKLDQLPTITQKMVREGLVTRYPKPFQLLFSLFRR